MHGSALARGVRVIFNVTSLMMTSSHFPRLFTPEEYADIVEKTPVYHG